MPLFDVIDRKQKTESLVEKSSYFLNPIMVDHDETQSSLFKQLTRRDIIKSIARSLAFFFCSMANPKPVQSDLLKQRRFQRVVVHHSCVPADAALAGKAISVKLPVELDRAVRGLGKQKAAWLREVIYKAALQEGLVDEP